MRGSSLAGRLAILGVSGLLVVAGCGANPTTTPNPAATPRATPTSRPTDTPSPAPTAAAPTAPAGTAFIEVPEAKILLPVPDGWRSLGAAELGDPAVSADLAATYPGAGDLLGAIGDLGGWASAAFLAVDPSPESLAAPLASNISVLVSQPSVGGSLLDFVAGMIGSSVADVLGADPPESEHVRLPAGEAVRLRYVVPAADGRGVSAVSWVIGAPGGTLLVTFMGSSAALAALDPEAIAGAITPVDEGR